MIAYIYVLQYLEYMFAAIHIPCVSKSTVLEKGN